MDFSVFWMDYFFPKDTFLNTIERLLRWNERLLKDFYVASCERLLCYVFMQSLNAFGLVDLKWMAPYEYVFELPHSAQLGPGMLEPFCWFLCFLNSGLLIYIFWLWNDSIYVYELDLVNYWLLFCCRTVLLDEPLCLACLKWRLLIGCGWRASLSWLDRADEANSFSTAFSRSPK